MSLVFLKRGALVGKGGLKVASVAEWKRNQFRIFRKVQIEKRSMKKMSKKKNAKEVNEE